MKKPASVDSRELAQFASVFCCPSVVTRTTISQSLRRLLRLFGARPVPRSQQPRRRGGSVPESSHSDPLRAGTSRGRQFRSAPILGAAAPKTADAGKFSLAHPAADALRPGGPRSAKTRAAVEHSRPQERDRSLGRSSHDGVGGSIRSRRIRTRCAPGRRALRFGLRLRRARSICVPSESSKAKTAGQGLFA